MILRTFYKYIISKLLSNQIEYCYLIVRVRENLLRLVRILFAHVYSIFKMYRSKIFAIVGRKKKGGVDSYPSPVLKRSRHQVQDSLSQENIVIQAASIDNIPHIMAFLILRIVNEGRT